MRPILGWYSNWPAMNRLYPCLLLPLLLVGAPAALAQTTGSVGIGTTSPDAKAALDIQATGKGLLIPRMDSASRAGIGTPPDGLMVFQTDGRKGFWYAVGGQWVYIPDKTKSGDNLGNHSATRNLGLNDYDLRLRGATDTNHGLGWYGTAASTKNWLSQNIDGPVLYGNSGGVLGTSTGSTRQSVLSWTNAGRVGIGTTSPNARLDLGQGALMLGAAIGNNATRPAVGTIRISGEISAYGLGGSGTPSASADDGYLRLSAGGGTSASTKTFIDLAGYSQQSDVNKTIRLGTAGQERLRVLASGDVGIGLTDPQQQLHVAGNIAADGPLGLILSNQDRPLVTRAWDAFTSGTYQGAGRWGVFMEPSTLAFGVPAGSTGRSFKWLTYNANSTVASTPMTLTQDGDLQLAGRYGYAAAQTRSQMLGPGDFISNDPPTSQATILYGSGPVPVGTVLTGSGMGTLLAPLDLPVGAVITNLEITVFDGDNNVNVSTQARITGIAGTVGSSNADAPSTPWVTVPQGSSVVVRGTGAVSMTIAADHAYMVEFQGNRSGALALLTVRVTYTVTQME